MTPPRLLLVLAGLALASACAPMTTKGDSKFDFQAYPNARVIFTGTYVPGETDYFFQEFTAHSGFVRLYDSAAPTSAAEVDLEVNFVLTTLDDASTRCILQYGVYDNYNGLLIEEGQESGDAWNDADACDNAIDEMVKLYRPDYRI